jgi:hypothetical protein
MSAIAIQGIAGQNGNFEVVKTHLEMLIENLRDVDLERRMITIIEADTLLGEWGGEEGTDATFNEVKLQGIRKNLEEEFEQIRRMLFLVERLQTHL